MATPSHISQFVLANRSWLLDRGARTLLSSLAIANMLEHEIHPTRGGFVDDPKDPGGATNWGISLRFLTRLLDEGGGDWDRSQFDKDRDGDVDGDDMRALTLDEAVSLYKSEFWDDTLVWALPPSVALKVFDLFVNMGPRRGTIILQKAINNFQPKVRLVEDGILGEKTMMAVWALYDAKDSAPELILTNLRSGAAAFYRSLVEQNSDFGRFINGWLKRAAS